MKKNNNFNSDPEFGKKLCDCLNEGVEDERKAQEKVSNEKKGK